MDNYNTPNEEMFFSFTQIANIDNFSKKLKNSDISSENIKLF